MGVMFGIIVATLALCGVVQAQTDASTESATTTGRDGRGPAPWKWDVVVYDRPGWSTPWVGAVRVIGNELVVTCTSHPEESYYDDWYAEESNTVTVASADGGRTWRIASPEEFSSGGRSDGGGTLIDVASVSALTEDEEAARKRGLEEAGLGHLYETSLGEISTGWLIYAESMAEELKAKGYSIYEDHPTIPEGQVAAFPNTIRARLSADGGSTWTAAEVGGLPKFGPGPVMGDQVRIDDATILQAFYAAELHDDIRSVYMLRSTDGGQTWATSKVPASSDLSLTEMSMLDLGDGQVFLMMRCDIGGDGFMYASGSDDGGQTWRPAERTPMRGQPFSLLRLRSGEILAAYCHRTFPGGIRACLSADGGRTWDIAREKILRDDVLPGPWISPCAAPSVQLEDDTILSVFTLPKVMELKPGEVANYGEFHVRPKYHTYVAASRYTVDYVRPLPGPEDDGGAADSVVPPATPPTP